MPSWSLQVVENTPTRLVIVEPPPHWMAGLVAGVGLILLVIAILNPAAFLMSKMTARMSMPQEGVQIGNLAAQVVRWVLVLAASPFLLLGWGILNSDIRATLDRPSRLLTVERRTFGLRRNVEIPLEQLDRATVEAGRTSRRVVVMLKSGAAVRVTGYSNRQGHYAVAKAINDFLGRSSP